MASAFADQQLSQKALEQLLTTLAMVRHGDFSKRLTGDGEGVEGEVADSVNELLTMLTDLTREFERVAESVSQGELRVRLPAEKSSGGWAQQLRAVNTILTVFGKHTAEVRRVVKSVQSGDLARTVAIGPEAIHRGGELLRLAEDVNGMIVHIERVTAEITRVFAEVGLDGRLNSQCHLSEVSGSWGMLVGSVNAASASLSEQVQDLSSTANAIAQGNLAARASSSSRGDLQTLKLGLHAAADGVLALCSELRRVQQEVVQEGKLSVELTHPNPRGDWLLARDACNRTWVAMADALRGAAGTAERLISGEPAPATAAPQAPGELGNAARQLERVAERDRRVQARIERLATGHFDPVSGSEDAREHAVTLVGSRLKQAWLRASRVTVLEARDQATEPAGFARAVLPAVVRAIDAAAAAYHVRRADGSYECIGNFGWDKGADGMRVTGLGEGLVGRAAAEGERIILDDLEAQGVRIRSSMFEIIPKSLLIFPVRDDHHVVAVLEFAFVRGSASAACELLDFLAFDLARGPRPEAASVSAPANSNGDGTRMRDLEEELVISNARLENMKHELDQRDKALRELNQELGRARGLESGLTSGRLNHG